MGRRKAAAGIITFHCSDNYGAMLQAYGLKRFLCGSGIETEIVRYEPPYMTGRHWLIPYMPLPRSPRWCLLNMGRGFLANLRIREQFAGRRANMKLFRRECLLEKGQRKIVSVCGMRRQKYTYYIVGSDQIWNPDITCGLRRVYFGDFSNRRKKKVIAYAASLGGTSIKPRYEEAFSRLLKHVDALSLREEAAVPYVKKFYEGDVRAVMDPVFFLKKEEWQKIEKLPDKKGYILVYVTERNSEMAEYVQELSQKKGLEVVEIWPGMHGLDLGFPLDYTAGPAEFLGYIHQAEYVVTNSFHMAAFSIIFQKRFLVFAHSSLNTRLQNMLKIHGLEDRICRGGTGKDIDAWTDWAEVHRRTEAAVRASGDFLQRSILT